MPGYYFDVAAVRPAKGLVLPRGPGIVDAITKWISNQFGSASAEGDTVALAVLGWMRGNNMFSGTVYRMRDLSSEAVGVARVAQATQARQHKGGWTKTEAIEALQKNLVDTLSTALLNEAKAEAAAKAERVLKKRRLC